MLTPGEGYAGGRTFFGSTNSRYVGIIPDDDIPSPQNALSGAPESLLAALARFYVGVADAYVRNETMNEENRSMMIHPSRLVEDHADYFSWVDDISQAWPRVFESGSSREREVLLARFREAYDDIAQTRDDISSFTEIERVLSFAISQTLVHRVNAASGRAPRINWHNRYAHILAGGQAMDRGFVVRGLTVTYMPRGRGVGNADTIQQRARFFGYKANIQGYCRIYLESNIRDAMVAYVRHEEAIRESLLKLEQTGTPLTAWRREFVLSPLLNLTRGNVYDSPVVRVAAATSGWTWPRFAYITDDTVKDNRLVFKEFRDGVNALKSEPFEGHDAYRGVVLNTVRNLLADYRTATPSDAIKFVAARERLDVILQANPGAVADVFDMIGGERKFRAGTKQKGIDQILQGPGSSGKYPGDRSIIAKDRVTVQLHQVEVRFAEGLRIESVPVLAIRFPEGLGPPVDQDIVLQPGNHTAQ